MSDEHPSSGYVPPLALVPIRSHARAPGESDHTTVRPLLRPIAAWRMDCSHFAFDSSFVSPHVRHELPELARLHTEHPKSPMSIFGHADPTGADDYNKQLSGRRALVAYALLVRDVDEWERLYTSPMSGDRWGEQAIQTILSTLTAADGEPYYQGEIDDDFGTASKEALEAYQSEHVDVDGAPLAADGILGPKTRKSMFRAYMDHLCTDDQGNVLELRDEHFLARGADPGHRGDVQGCSEFNPLMVFSKEEHAAFSKPSNKEQRDEENATNRRAVVFLYPEGVQVHPEHWPCPKAESGAATCRERFWSDAVDRRNPQEQRRHFDGDRDTFACRFYHYFGDNTPAETPETLGLTFDVYLHREAGLAGPTGTYRMVSDDGEVDLSKGAAEAVLMRLDARGEVRCLSFTGLRRGKAYTLSFQPGAGDQDEFEPVVLVAGIRLDDFIALGRGAKTSDETEEVGYVKSESDAYLSYEPDPDKEPIDWSIGAQKRDEDGEAIDG